MLATLQGIPKDSHYNPDKYGFVLRHKPTKHIYPLLLLHFDISTTLKCLKHGRDFTVQAWQRTDGIQRYTWYSFYHML